MRDLPRRRAMWVRAFGLAVPVLMTIATANLFAQSAPVAPAPVPVRPMYLEWGITVVMIGLVLFAVCRTSNRQ